MKKIIRILIIAIIVAIAGGGTLLVFNKLMLVRLPVLVHQNAKVTFVFGTAHVRLGDDGSWRQLIVGTPLKNSYQVKTCSWI